VPRGFLEGGKKKFPEWERVLPDGEHVTFWDLFWRGAISLGNAWNVKRWDPLKEECVFSA